MGCPGGIGPEIILKYFSNISRPPEVRSVVIGDIGILEKCGRDLGLPAPCIPWQPGQSYPESGIPVLSVSSLDLADHSWGHFTQKSSKCMADYILTAVKLAKNNIIDGITTCPISKSALQLAGHKFPGHTEMLVELTGAQNYTMMMAGDSLKVTLTTIHCALSQVPAKLTESAIYNLIHITNNALKTDFGINSPNIAVAGLNPHSSEDGLFGTEEENVITPAIHRAIHDGVNASGPYPPDTVFFKASSGLYDAVVCMYHDQGLIPFKLLHFKDGVNVTLGLPIVRTSVDHGTAYDIAGKGLADETSLSCAVAMASDICKNRITHNSK
ncbi:4-hydroxythreonine-4-phosphate dehydrogenase PdxA [Desulfosediminicola flagellatus]|uniref:4-hydroxythreonine-4-phosphate dehydrogenase PdxA n=1 Tax=Desulfosediminicola flagellatus TaxID=2569541 RepID=UPI0010ABEF3D|nr:4-hydroxythreonine-4-phosphate dehydrogenase PdxA [Desulfosediminicola flagellatus]